MLKNADCTVSKIFATARIYALLSIVCAHMAYVGTFSFVLLNRFGTIGVVVFLIMSGYFYKPAKFSSFENLLKKKFFTLCLPWFFMGTLTWCYKAILTPDYRTLSKYLSWILGNGSYLYYMPMLLLCFILMYKIHKTFRLIAVAVNVLSILLTAMGVLAPVLTFLGINSYLNVFNWIGFFSLGMLLQDTPEEKIVFFLLKYRFWFIAAFVAAFTLIIVFHSIPADYFSFVAIPYEIIGALAFFGLSTFVLTDIPIFKKLSDTSFAIYLIHMIFVGLFDGVMSHFAVTRLSAPFVIILSAFMTLLISSFMANKLKLKKLFSLITGIRK